MPEAVNLDITFLGGLAISLLGGYTKISLGRVSTFKLSKEMRYRSAESVE